jgi:uncharacterized membrane protein
VKKVVPFIKDRIITGVIVVVPIAVIVVILSKAIKKLITLTSPITSNLEIGGTFVRTIFIGLLIVILLVLFFFVNGLILKTYLGNRFKNWLNHSLLDHIP